MQHRCLLFIYKLYKHRKRTSDTLKKSYSKFSQLPLKPPTVSDYSVQRSQKSNVPSMCLRHQILLQIQKSTLSIFHIIIQVHDGFKFKTSPPTMRHRISPSSRLSREVAVFPLAVASIFYAIFSTYYVTSLQI